MTPHERASEIASEYAHHSDERQLMIADITAAIEAALAHDRAQRAVPGAPLTEGQVEAIRQLEKAATPGPWEWARDYELADGLHWGIRHPTDDSRSLWPLVTASTDPQWHELPDPLFIAAAREAVPALLAHLAFLEALLRDAAAHGELEQWQRGELAGWNAAIEAAARVVAGRSLPGPDDVGVAILRSLKRPAP